MKSHQMMRDGVLLPHDFNANVITQNHRVLRLPLLHQIRVKQVAITILFSSYVTPHLANLMSS